MKKILKKITMIISCFIMILCSLSFINLLTNNNDLRYESNRKYIDSNEVESINQAVPNSGYIDNVYLNIDMPAVEVYQTILNANLTFINFDGSYFGYLVCLDENYNGLFILYAGYPDSDPFIGMAYGSVADIETLPAIFMYMQAGQWTEHAPANGVIDVDSTLLPELYLPADALGTPEDVILPVGLENEKLKSIISITPFSEDQEEETIIGTLLSSIGLGISSIIEVVVDGIKESFLEFVFVDKDSSNLVVSDLSYFLFAMLGLSIGVGLIWLVILLFKRRS